jgi:hypothetical protein
MGSHSQLHVQPPLSPLSGIHPGLPHSLSAPAAIPGIHRNHSPGLDLKTPMSEAGPHTHRNNTYPSPRYRTHVELASANTPNSSSPSSPQRPSPGLPPINIAGTPIPASVFARRVSSTGLVPGTSGSYIPRPRASSSYRRPSISAKSVMSITDSQASLQNSGGVPGTSHYSPGLKHVGDGALSDSDSSGNEEDHEDGLGEDDPDSTPDPANDDGLEGDIFRLPLVSPYLFPRNSASHRSPLSKLVRQQGWRSDEDEDRISPSPASSDSDNGGVANSKMRVLSTSSAGVSFYSSNVTRHPTGRKRSGTTHSRSSTVASLAASSAASPTVGPVPGNGGGTGGLTIPKRTVSKQESRSSIRTVVAVSENATPTRDVPDPYSSYSQGGPVKLTETPRKVSNGESKNGSAGRPLPFSHRKQLSEAAMSDLLLDDHDDSRSQSQSQRGGLNSRKQILRKNENVAKRREDIERAERRFRDSGWDVVKESLEIYAEEVRSWLDIPGIYSG